MHVIVHVHMHVYTTYPTWPVYTVHTHTLPHHHSHSHTPSLTHSHTPTLPHHHSHSHTPSLTGVHCGAGGQWVVLPAPHHIPCHCCLLQPLCIRDLTILSTYPPVLYIVCTGTEGTVGIDMYMYILISHLKTCTCTCTCMF